MKKRLVTLLLLNVTALLMLASVAAAEDHGEGWWGETTDLDITVAGFILIAGFPLIILVNSLIMWRLDKRKDARKAAAKARAARAGTRGGW